MLGPVSPEGTRGEGEKFPARTHAHRLSLRIDAQIVFRGQMHCRAAGFGPGLALALEDSG